MLDSSSSSDSEDKKSTKKRKKKQKEKSDHKRKKMKEKSNSDGKGKTKSEKHSRHRSKSDNRDESSACSSNKDKVINKKPSVSSKRKACELSEIESPEIKSHSKKHKRKHKKHKKHKDGGEDEGGNRHSTDIYQYSNMEKHAQDLRKNSSDFGDKKMEYKKSKHKCH